MRLVVARCTVDYDGRLQAHLPSAVRLVMVKADGCVAIHADGGAYKPLNWMNAPNRLRADDDAGVWTVTSPKGEVLTITFEERLSDTTHEMGTDPGLQKDGVEAHLQALLAELRDGGVDTLVMEVSSIGLSQRRVDGIGFHTGVFTNLSQDHLDFHGDMDRYRDAKARLFRELLRAPGGQPRALLCADDPAWPGLDPPEDRWLYGTSPDSDLRIVDARFDANGTALTLETPAGNGTLRSG